MDLVLVPAVTGDFGVMPGHVPTVAQLRPGVVTVHNELDKDVEKYFVSSGFAFVHADSSADVVAVEAVKLDELDTEAVRAGLQVISLYLYRFQSPTVFIQRQQAAASCKLSKQHCTTSNISHFLSWDTFPNAHFYGWLVISADKDVRHGTLKQARLAWKCEGAQPRMHNCCIRVQPFLT